MLAQDVELPLGLRFLRLRAGGGVGGGACHRVVLVLRSGGFGEERPEADSALAEWAVEEGGVGRGGAASD